VGDRLVPKLDHTLEPEATTLCGVEEITGTGRRCGFCRFEKPGLVEATLSLNRLFVWFVFRVLQWLTSQQVFTSHLPVASETAGRKFAPAVWIRRYPRGHHLDSRAKGYAQVDPRY